MSEKAKKVWSIVANVLVIVILALVVFVTINIILSRDKGYTAFFGKTHVAVKTDSMDGPMPEGEEYQGKLPGFKQGDFITVKILDDKGKKALEVGDIITFYQTINGQRELNTHRIIAITTVGEDRFYTTKGDNAESRDTLQKAASEIVGIYTGSKLPVLGYVINFFHTSAGFFVCVVIPSFLIVAYFAVNLILTIRKTKAEEKAAAGDEKEQMRQELLKELIAQGKISADDVNAEGGTAETENSETEETAESNEDTGETGETEQESSEGAEKEE